MLGLFFRFVSGLVVGVPAAMIAYIFLPLLVADISSAQIWVIGLSAGLVGATQPALLLKGLACSLIWRNF